MANDATAFVLAGPAQLLYGDAGLEQELGKTWETPVVVRIREDAFPIHHHQTGSNRWDAITIGKTVEVEASFSNLSWLLMMNTMPTETELCDSVTTPTAVAGDQSLELTAGLGTSHRDAAKRLIVKPYYNGAPSLNAETWFFFPLAYPRVEAEVNHAHDVQKVWHVVFEIFPVSQDCPRLMFMGNEAMLCGCD